MSQYNRASLKEKITPRDKSEIEKKAADRFKKADETLGMENEPVLEKEKKSMTRVIRKTFSIPEKELSLIEKIKNNALNNKLVLGESEVLRLGLLVISSFSSDELEKSARLLEKIPMGRPSKKK